MTSGSCLKTSKIEIHRALVLGERFVIYSQVGAMLFMLGMEVSQP